MCRCGGALLLLMIPPVFVVSIPLNHRYHCESRGQTFASAFISFGKSCEALMLNTEETLLQNRKKASSYGIYGVQFRSIRFRDMVRQWCQKSGSVSFAAAKQDL